MCVPRERSAEQGIAVAVALGGHGDGGLVSRLREACSASRLRCERCRRQPHSGDSLHAH